MADNNYYLPVTKRLRESFELSDEENGFLKGSTQKFYYTFMPIVLDIEGQYPYREDCREDQWAYYNTILKANEFTGSQQEAFCAVAKIIGPLISSRLFKHRPTLLLHQQRVFGILCSALIFMTQDSEASRQLIEQWAKTGTCSTHPKCQSNMEQLLKEYTDASKTDAGNAISTKLQQWKQDLSEERSERDRKEDQENAAKRLEILGPMVTARELV